MRCEKRKCEDRLTCTGWSHTEGMENTEAWRFLIKGSNCLSSSHPSFPLGLRRAGSALIQALMPINQKSPACRLLVSKCCRLVSGQEKRKIKCILSSSHNHFPSSPQWRLQCVPIACLLVLLLLLYRSGCSTDCHFVHAPEKEWEGKKRGAWGSKNIIPCPCWTCVTHTKPDCS